MTIQTTQPVHEPAATVPLQVAVAEVTEAPRAADHVRTHGRACWWDFVECRWVCAGD